MFWSSLSLVASSRNHPADTLDSCLTYRIANFQSVSWILVSTLPTFLKWVEPRTWMDSPLFHWTRRYQGLTVFCALDYSSCALMKCIFNIYTIKFWLQLKNVEVWFQRASDVVRKLKSGDIDMGIVGYDMLREYGEVRVLTHLQANHTLAIANIHRE